MQFPKEFPLVLGGLVLTGVTLTALTFRVGGMRKAAGVAYPALYADNAEAKVDQAKFKFNCAQRGVMNLVETYAQTLASFLAIAGLSFPRVAAGLSVAWSVGAVAFAVGYSSGDPDKRYAHAWWRSAIGAARLRFSLRAYSAFELIKASS
jgi:glutathione S-transferase